MGKLLFFLENIGEMCFFAKKKKEKKKREKKRDENPYKGTPTQNQFSLQKARKTYRKDLPSSNQCLCYRRKKYQPINTIYYIQYIQTIG
jgi:hypothetical protein